MVGSFLTAAWSAPQDAAGSREAAIDLGKIELLKPVGTNVRNLAELTYSSEATVAAAYAFHEKQLKAAGFEPGPDAMVTDQYASAVFRGKGDRLAVMIFPAGGKDVSVTISNQGDVDLASLPVPEGAQKLYAGPSNVSYVSEKPVADVNAAVAARLAAAGWSPFGEAGPIRFFKKGPVLVQTMIQSAPGQGGKTALDYQSKRMSADIDAPEGAVRISWAEATKSLDVDVKGSLDDVASSYGKILAARGWKATTERPITEKFEKFWIFRNQKQEMLDLKLRQIDDITRILAKFMTAAEVEEESRKAEIAAKKAMSKSKAMKSVTIAEPAEGVESWKVTPMRISAVARTGQARKVAESIRDASKKDGWKVSVEVLENLAGTISMEKDDISISIVYDDTGVTPAELTISVSGGNFTVPGK